MARLLGGGSRIYAVDRDADALASLQRGLREDGVEIVPVAADFTRPLSLPGAIKRGLDGMLLANALHFVAEPADAIARLVDWLRPGGRLVVIEYDGRRANRWVPYPIPAGDLPGVLIAAGFTPPTITATRPSAYGGTVYVAAADILKEP